MRCALLLLPLLAACAPAAPTRADVVSAGVGHALFEVRARHTDLVAVHVYFPSDGDGRPIGSGRPGVVFIQGGFVDAQRYGWQGQALARAGYVTAMPEHAGNLAFFELDNGTAAAALLREPPKGSVLDGLVDSTRIGAAGHSLGGVVAVKVAAQAKLAAVALEASYPDTADVALVAGWSVPSLSLAGRSDCAAKLEQTTAGSKQLASPTAFVVLDGVTHYQFTDSDREDRAQGCVGTTSLEDAHTRIAAALTGFFDAALSGGGVGGGALAQVPGAEVSVR